MPSQELQKRWTVEISRVSLDGGAIAWKLVHEKIQKYLSPEASC